MRGELRVRLDDGLEALDAAKDDEQVLEGGKPEALPLQPVRVALVRGSERQVVPATKGALGPDGGQVLGEPDREAPVQPQLLARLARRHHRRRLARPRRHPHRHPRPRGQPAVHTHLLGQPDNRTRAAVLGAALLRDEAFAVGALLRRARVVGCVERREQSDAAEVGVHREDGLSQVLRALEVLQQPRHKDRAVCALRSRGRRAVAGKDDNLVDVEDGGRASDLADQVAAQLLRLRVVDDRAGQRERHGPRPAGGGGGGSGGGRRSGGAGGGGSALRLGRPLGQPPLLQDLVRRGGLHGR
mmetsp:Transcript_49131/g.162662  ORF Transcript_49131/g.162662 Transcript_49131/m.162662 type:complete len:300 (+) Transcript_49131:321-1220(+)